MGSGKIFVGMGGWTFAPWRGVFYPHGLPRRRELEFASRHVTSIEINGTYYSTFKPATWTKWRDETPAAFRFAVKGSRYCTNRGDLATAGEAVARFVGQGLSALGDRLGPINWQMMESKRFDAGEMEAFLGLLPREVDGIALRHALEVRNASFRDARFYDLARRYRVAIVVADSDAFPMIDEPTAGFAYARLMRSREEVESGYPDADLGRWARRARQWARRGDAYLYFIGGAKARAPAAARALLSKL